MISGSLCEYRNIIAALGASPDKSSGPGSVDNSPLPEKKRLGRPPKHQGLKIRLGTTKKEVSAWHQSRVRDWRGGRGGSRYTVFGTTKVKTLMIHKSNLYCGQDRRKLGNLSFVGILTSVQDGGLQ